MFFTPTSIRRIVDKLTSTAKTEPYDVSLRKAVEEIVINENVAKKSIFCFKKTKDDYKKLASRSNYLYEVNMPGTVFAILNEINDFYPTFRIGLFDSKTPSSVKKIKGLIQECVRLAILDNLDLVWEKIKKIIIIAHDEYKHKMFKSYKELCFHKKVSSLLVFHDNNKLKFNEIGSINSPSLRK